MFRVSRDSVWIGYAGSITVRERLSVASRPGVTTLSRSGPIRSPPESRPDNGGLIRLPDGRVEDEPQASA